jgi:molybdate transport system ATP-binding protein
MTTTTTVDQPAPVTIDAITSVGTFRVSATFTTAGGITALFGPSGSGKSVTLATLAGLLRPERGSIVIEGVVVADADRRVHIPTQRRPVGMMFQHAALLPHRSPLDNVALAVGARRRAQRRAEAHRWLERVHAAHLADAPTSNLSGGEAQRVALARALARSPRVLLLDEPFSALDLPTRQSLRELIRELVETEGLTALVVTHDLDDIAHLADRVVLFEPGCTTGIHVLTGPRGEDLPALLGLTRT